MGNKFPPGLSSDPQGIKWNIEGFDLWCALLWRGINGEWEFITGGGNAVIERTVSGSRDQAGKVVRRMIDRLLDGKLTGEAGELRD